MFCSIAILIALLHPSIVFLAVLPLFVYGFFMTENGFKFMSKFLMMIMAIYFIMSYSFHLAFLLMADD